MNDIEKAIKTAKENYITACHDADGDNPKYEKDQLRFYELAIQALQEKAEREKGCIMCNEKRPFHNVCSPAELQRDLNRNFCPMCGRDLKKKDAEKALEGLRK